MQITLRKSVTMLNCVLSKPSAAKNVSWRQSAELFKAPEPGSALVSGEIKMSPAQFQLGHTVCLDPRTPDLRSPSYHPELWIPPRSPTPVNTNELDYRYWRIRELEEAQWHSRREEIAALDCAWRGLLETIQRIGETSGTYQLKTFFLHHVFRNTIPTHPSTGTQTTKGTSTTRTKMTKRRTLEQSNFHCR
jgi:hypothetical protein